MSGEENEPAAEEEASIIIYAVRYSQRASHDVADATLRLAQITEDRQKARQWRSGLRARIGTLSSSPRRYAVDAQASQAMGMPGTRKMLYRASEGAAAYHVFYAVDDETPDGPRVTVLHIRHAARKPMTRAEGRGIMENQSE